MRIRILDPHWEKMDPNPGHEHFFKIYWFFSTFFASWFRIQEAKILQIHTDPDPDTKHWFTCYAIPDFQF